jgi:TldD protein
VKNLQFFSTRTVAGLMLALLTAASIAVPLSAAQAKDPKPADVKDNDQTLRAMKDEMDRSRDRLQFGGADKPFYIEYRLLDLDIRTVTASFGALVSSDTNRVRYMTVGLRVGNYHLDSSNFVSDDGFRGFLGSAGQVGIDRDYNSLRQDLWLATDQAYKEALTQMSLKNAFLRSLTKAPEIDDFSEETPVVDVEPHSDANWTARNWEEEARKASAAFAGFPDLYGGRVTYYMVFATSYLMTSEGTEIRMPSTLAAIEAALDTQAEDGMPLHNFYSVYTSRPNDLPDPGVVAKALQQASQNLEALRSAPILPDYSGPVLFDAPAAGSLLAQVLAPSLSGARPPLATDGRFYQFLEQMGGHNDWTGRVGQRVLPANVTLTDDPTITSFQGQALLGGYDVDSEGVRAQKVTLVDSGILRNLLMSRRPGPEFYRSNGHARSADLSDPMPLSSNLIFQSTEGVSSADLRKKFLQACKDDGHDWCLEVKAMDNPAVAAIHPGDFQDAISSMAEGVASGERLPLMVYRVSVGDGHEELVRGAHVTDLTVRTLRNIESIGNDLTAFNYMQNPEQGLAGTAVGAFGSAEAGIPSSVVAPSLLLEDIEFRGFHGEPRRVPLVPAPPLQ